MNRQEINGYAVDIGGTKTAAARIAAGEVVGKRTCATDGTADLDAHLETVEDMISDLGWSKASGDVLGVTVTGRVSVQGEWSAVNAGTLSLTENAPLGDALKERFGAVNWSNDASASALAEYLLGAGIGSDNFAYITVSTGVGGGLVFHGRLLESGSGLAGHLGFSTSRLAETRCGCGRMGTVESVSSGRAIAQAAADAGHAGLDAREVFIAARASEGWAETIVDRSARAIAELCGNITAILDPDAIAIGGSVGLAEGYIERVQAHLAEEPILFRRSVMRAQLGADSPLLGALAHGMRQAA